MLCFEHAMLVASGFTIILIFAVPQVKRWLNRIP